MTNDNYPLTPAARDCQLEIQQGLDFYARDEFDKARQVFERAIACQPDNVHAMAGLAKVLIVEGFFADAKELYEAAVNHGLEKTGENLTNLAICYAFEGENESARTLMEGAIAVDPSYEPVYGALARHCLIMGDYLAAERYATEGLRLFSLNIPCLEARALAKLAMLNIDGAEADAQAILKIEPDSVDGLLCHASVLMASGEVTQAVTWLQRAESIDPDNAEVLLVFGGAYQLQGKLKLAESYYHRAEKLEPYNWRCYQSLASLDLLNSHNEFGLEHVDIALELQDAPVLHYLRGEFLARLGKANDALHEFTLATQANELDVLSWIGMAEIEAQDPSMQNAAKLHAQKAISIESTSNVAKRASRILQGSK